MAEVSKKILIIDDDPLIRKIFSKYLVGKKYTIVSAENGSSGIEIFHKEKPDLVLTDLRMPQVTGLDVLKNVTASAVKIPIIVVSGTDDVKEMIEALRLGAWDYIIKPVEDFEVLNHAVERALERARLLEENERYKEHLEEEVKSRTKAFEDELTMRTVAEKLLFQSLDNVQRIMNGVIRTISNIGDIRDPYTGGHQHRVALLSRRLAEEMKLDEDQIKSIYIAGQLHDIGKMSIALEILSKPGKITDLEFEMIKTHTVTGFNILKEIEFPWPIAQIVLQHHEKIDGTGYPNGIKGEDILLEAKIISVADVVEAIASHRPYRPSLGMDKALDTITSKRGKHFDPEVVDAFVSIVKSGFNFEDIEKLESKN